MKRVLCLLFSFWFFFYNEGVKCLIEKEDRPFSESEAADIGASAGDIISSSSSASKQGYEPSSSDTNIAGEIMKGIKTIPAPVVSLDEELLLDPDVVCERDYSFPCPNDYNYIGGAKVDDEELCAPSSDYDGPCKGQELNIKNMSESAKEHWSQKCQTFWPCKKCVRNFSELCPEKWHKVKDSIRTCEPTKEYHGPCNFPVNFSGYNARMLENWSMHCKAWWKCDHLALLDDSPDRDQPITSAATQWRMKRNYQ